MKNLLEEQAFKLADKILNNILKECESADYVTSEIKNRIDNLKDAADYVANMISSSGHNSDIYELPTRRTPPVI